MDKLFGVLSGKKTYVTAALGVIGAVAGIATGDVSAVSGAQTVLGCLLAAFLRNGNQ